MAENSKIEWTDHTFNPWRGCTKVSPGCANCYAEALSKRTGHGEYRRGVPRERTSVDNWKKPLKWNRIETCVQCGSPHKADKGDGLYRCLLCNRRPRVFCASLADWLDDEVPIEWLADLLKLIHDTPNLDWLLLTKRPENWHGRLNEAAKHWDNTPHIDIASWIYWWTDISGSGKAPANAWIGTTCETQEYADKRIPELLKIPAKVRFLSCEPLLGPVDLRPWLKLSGFKEGYDAIVRQCGGEDKLPEHLRWNGILPPSLHWVIAGGESGPKSRPMEIAWAESLAAQCASFGVPFFMKQGSQKNWPNFKDFSSFPVTLQKREFPR
jgi:protein gp37